MDFHVRSIYDIRTILSSLPASFLFKTVLKKQACATKVEEMIVYYDVSSFA